MKGYSVRTLRGSDGSAAYNVGLIWYGRGKGRVIRFGVPLPAPWSERYDASAQLRTGSRWKGPRILSFSVIDRASAGSATFRGQREVLSVPRGVTDAYVQGLWRVSRKILGSQLRSGGPPSGTGTSVDDLIAAANEQREPDGRWPSEEDVAWHLDRDVMTIRRVARLAPGTGTKHWERLLALAEGRASWRPRQES